MDCLNSKIAVNQLIHPGFAGTHKLDTAGDSEFVEFAFHRLRAASQVARDAGRPELAAFAKQLQDLIPTARW